MVPYRGAKELVYALLRLKGASDKISYLIHRVQWLDEILIGHSSKQNKKTKWDDCVIVGSIVATCLFGHQGSSLSTNRVPHTEQ